MQDVHVKLNPGLPWQKHHSTRSFFHQKIGLKCKKDTSRMVQWEYNNVRWWNLDPLESTFRNIFEVLKCDTIEEWRRSVGLPCEKWRSVTQSQTWEEYPNTRKRRKANWIGHILCWNCLLEPVIEGKVGGRMEVTKRRGRRRKQLVDDSGKREDTGNWKRKHWLALCGEQNLEYLYMFRPTDNGMSESANQA